MHRDEPLAGAERRHNHESAPPQLPEHPDVLRDREAVSKLRARVLRGLPGERRVEDARAPVVPAEPEWPEPLLEPAPLPPGVDVQARAPRRHVRLEGRPPWKMGPVHVRRGGAVERRGCVATDVTASWPSAARGIQRAAGTSPLGSGARSSGSKKSRKLYESGARTIRRHGTEPLDPQEPEEPSAGGVRPGVAPPSGEPDRGERVEVLVAREEVHGSPGCVRRRNDRDRRPHPAAKARRAVRSVNLHPAPVSQSSAQASVALLSGLPY